ncbi:ABC transporter permease [Lactococcus termiticola]|uniref:Spermidine/putrescine ABC transporter permease protein n=1 Tax=Lactococcus termiticola TaxID=2169526 RepID=A0A2R5HKQ2_9LACT|nr:ABC transporter permease [Lactococcus termiticola]GBG97201.1 spermidine/putrescine ABC transporter permease protein [Lactococcus termiticola]
MTSLYKKLYAIPYYLWLGLFVIIPLVMLLWQSFSTTGSDTVSFDNYIAYFSTPTYLLMTWNSVVYALIVTVLTLVISYPVAYILTRLKYKQLWLMLIILPTWINLLLKTYAFIGIFGQYGSVNNFLTFVGLGRHQILFTDASFIIVASYISIPFMILPIFNALEEMDDNLVDAARDLGANGFQTFIRVVWPLSLNGVRSGVQAVFIPSLSLFMLTRLIGGNKVITLGTAVEEHFLTTQNWGMGSTIAIILVLAMVLIMYLTRERGDKK